MAPRFGEWYNYLMQNNNIQNAKMSLFGIMFFTLGNIVGSGVLSMPADLAQYPYIAIFIGLIITCCCAFALSFTFIELNKNMPEAGGPHIYSYRMFGNFVGFQMAWAYWIFSWASNATLCIATIKYLSFFYPILQNSQWICFCLEMTMLWSISYINTKSIAKISTLQITITCIKILPLLGFALYGIYKCITYVVLYPNQLLNTNIVYSDITCHNIWHFLRQLGGVLSITLWAFIGIESAAVPDSTSHKTNVKIGTLFGVGLSSLIYLFGNISIFFTLSIDFLKTSNVPFVDATRILLGNNFAFIIALIGLIGIIFTLNGWILIQGHVPLSMAKEKLLPNIFIYRNKYNAPSRSIYFGSILISIMLFFLSSLPFNAQFIWAAFFSTFTIAITYFYASIAAIFINIINGDPKYNIYINSISAIYSLMCIWFLPYDVIAYGTLLTFCLSVPFYVFIKGKLSVILPPTKSTIKDEQYKNHLQ